MSKHTCRLPLVIEGTFQVPILDITTLFLVGFGILTRSVGCRRNVRGEISKESVYGGNARKETKRKTAEKMGR